MLETEETRSIMYYSMSAYSHNRISESKCSSKYINRDDGGILVSKINRDDRGILVSKIFTMYKFISFADSINFTLII